MKIYNFSLKDLQFYLQGLPAHNTLKAAKVEDIRHCSHHLGNRKDYKTAVIDEATLTLILMMMMLMMMVDNGDDNTDYAWLCDNDYNYLGQYQR